MLYIKPTFGIGLALVLFFACKKDQKPSTPAPNNQTPSTQVDPFKDINNTLVTANSSKEALAVYQFLRNNYGKKILSGVMTLNSFDETSWLKNNTGKEPAIVGLDFMHCNRNYNWYDNEQPIKDAKTYWDKNGIPVMVWHWRDPSRTTEEFYTSKTTFDVSKINDASSNEYKAIISDIDFVSGLIKKITGPACTCNMAAFA